MHSGRVIWLYLSVLLPCEWWMRSFLNHSNIEAVPNKRQPGDSPRKTKQATCYLDVPNRRQPGISTPNFNNTILAIRFTSMAVEIITEPYVKYSEETLWCWCLCCPEAWIMFVHITTYVYYLKLCDTDYLNIYKILGTNIISVRMVTLIQ